MRIGSDLKQPHQTVFIQPKSTGLDKHTPSQNAAYSVEVVGTVFSNQYSTSSLAWPHPVLQEREGVW